MATRPPLLLRYLIGIGPTALSQTASGTGDLAVLSVAEGKFSWEGGRIGKPHPYRSDGFRYRDVLLLRILRHCSVGMCRKRGNDERLQVKRFVAITMTSQPRLNMARARNVAEGPVRMA